MKNPNQTPQKTKTKPKIRAVKSNRGRKTKYKPEYAATAEILCQMRADNPILAEYFGVALSTIGLWLQKHPEFSDAVKRGKFIADGKVANALYKSAVGEHYVVSERHNAQTGEVITLAKQIAPDFRAQQFWLSNRQPKLWRHKPDIADTQASAQSLTEIGEKYAEIMARAHERQRQVLIERGIIEPDK